MAPRRVLAALSLAGIALAAQPIMVVDLRSTASIPTQLAVQTCAGLFNRNESAAGAAYIFMQTQDDDWWRAVVAPASPSSTNMTASAFLAKCLKTVSTGRLRYNYKAQQAISPNIITLAGVLDAVPLEDADPASQGVPVVFDALESLANFTARDATEYVWQRYVDRTTTMAKLNPGLDVHSKPLNPPLTKDIEPFLVDYVVKERLFALFMNNNCVPGTEEHALMEKITQNNPWPRPIRVYGYDDTYPLAGDIFEAETTCVKEHNMGQIASNGVNNLGFFSREPAIDSPLKQNPEPTRAPYNKSRTYIAFIVGDGDNVGYVKGQHLDYMKKRVAACAGANPPCYPLTWTQSPQVLHLAPAMMRWYFDQARATGADYFVLPPSGDTYSYPAMMSGQDQINHIRNTERDCQIMNCSGTVDWEWFTTWKSAIEDFYPKYAQNKVIKGLFSVNVPYMFPVLRFGPKEFFKVFDDSVVAFRPREWRGVTGKSYQRTLLSAPEMAKEVNGYPEGTVTYIYFTSDGGGSVESTFDALVPLLDEHVEVVTPNAAVEMALQSSRQ